MVPGPGSTSSFSLPLRLKGLELPPEPSQREEEDLARIAAAEAAIRAIEQAQHHMGEGRGDADLYIDAGARIMELYRQRINGRSTTGKEASLARRIDEIERRLRLTGFVPNGPKSSVLPVLASSPTRPPASWSESLICWSRASQRGDARNLHRYGLLRFRH
jgi:hypothetical protein